MKFAQNWLSGSSLITFFVTHAGKAAGRKLVIYIDYRRVVGSKGEAGVLQGMLSPPSDGKERDIPRRHEHPCLRERSQPCLQGRTWPGLQERSTGEVTTMSLE